jgi:hypothetical protein
MTMGSLWTFETGTFPDTPAAPDPQNGAIQVALDQVLSWGPAAGALTYNVCFGTENPPPPGISGLTVTQWDPPGFLEPETQYYWEIATVNAIGTTLGPIWAFTTDILAADDERTDLLPRAVTLGPVYPNPFNATVTIPFMLPNAGSVRLELFDILGRNAALISSGFFGAGAHEFTWNSAGVGTGVYLLKLTAGAESQVVKVISLK